MHGSGANRPAGMDQSLTCGGGQVRLARLGFVGDAGGAPAAPLCTVGSSSSCGGWQVLHAACTTSAKPLAMLGARCMITCSRGRNR